MSKRWNFRSVRIALLLAVMAVLTGGIAVRGVESKLLTKDELKSLVAGAKTAQDHERLAAHFAAKADELDAEAREHTELAAEYKVHPTIHEQKHPMSGQTASHCDFFAAELRKAAQGARQLAADHEKMAKEVK